MILENCLVEGVCLLTDQGIIPIFLHFCSCFCFVFVPVPLLVCVSLSFVYVFSSARFLYTLLCLSVCAGQVFMSCFEKYFLSQWTPVTNTCTKS